jgi:transposase
MSVATPKVPVNRIREILRQKWTLGLSNRTVAQSVGCGPATVHKVVHAALAADLTWEAVASLDNAALDVRVRGATAKPRRAHTELDCAALRRELAKPGVTLELLHQEYLSENPSGYRYSQFCRLYREFVKHQRTSMRQQHVAGERLFVDYSGQRPYLTIVETGERLPVEFFVAVLGASNLTYVEATLTQRLPEFLGSHMRAFEAFGGVPRLVVSDQLRSAVSKPCRYEAGLNPTYEAMLTHYEAAGLPARPCKPKDKAKVEGCVLIVQRWILARIRHETFSTLADLNRRLAELCEELNNRTMIRYKQSRRQLFEEHERRELRALPVERFAMGEFTQARVGEDYHVEFDRHHYSVPHNQRLENTQRVEIRATHNTIEVFAQGQRIASHVRSYIPFAQTTILDHMPQAHRQCAQWTAANLLEWATKIGPETAIFIAAILESKRHPEQGLRPCLGVLRLAAHHGPARLEAACARALAHKAISYHHVKEMLRHRLEAQPGTLDADASEASLPPHENIRGAAYYSH